MNRPSKRFFVLSVWALVVFGGACLALFAIARHRIASAQSPLAGLTRSPASTEPSQEMPLPTSRAPGANGPTVRVAVIGGMVETGFWNALADRYRDETGVTIQLIAAGPKDHLEHAFKDGIGGIDLITMHSSDTIMNLVADGYCIDPQPWMRNDLVIVGPPEDPAHIAGMKDAAAALSKIADAHAMFVVHSSLGAQEVLRNILELHAIHLDESRLKILFLDNQRNVLKIAAQLHAYTMVGRIPFRSGKLQNEGLKLMVSGDPSLRRPYVVAISNPARIAGVHFSEAAQLAKWMRSEPTRRWIATFGAGRLDDEPLFFPVADDLAHFAQ